MKVTETYMVVVDHEGKQVHETMTLIPKGEGLSEKRAEGIAYVRCTEMFVMILNEMLKQPKQNVVQMANMWSKMELVGYRVHKMSVTFETIGEPLTTIAVTNTVMDELPETLRDLFQNMAKKMELEDKEKLYTPPPAQRPKREEFRQKGFNTPFDGLNLN